MIVYPPRHPGIMVRAGEENRGQANGVGAERERSHGANQQSAPVPPSRRVKRDEIAESKQNHQRRQAAAGLRHNDAV